MDSVAIASRDQTIAQQRETIREQQRVIEVIQQANEQLRQQVEQLQCKVRELEVGKPKGMPGNKQGSRRGKQREQSEPQADKERGKREVNYARKRESEPSVRVEHVVGECPKCQVSLSHGTKWRSREVIEVVPSRAVVTEHVYIERECPDCGHLYRPKPELEGVVVGKRRFGVRLVSLIATVGERPRLPVRRIQWYLKTVHELHVSTGAIVDALRSVAERGKGEVEQVLAAIRAAPVVNADETGWREDGKNGHAWVYSTPTEKYFMGGSAERQQRRGA